MGTRLECMARLPQCDRPKIERSKPAFRLIRVSTETRSSRWTWLALWIVALGTRLPAVFLLPTPEQDGYSYAELIAQLSAKLSAGQFRVVDLYGFWLPLFQFSAAALNLWIDNPLFAGKIVSSLCGAVSCVLVFAITKKLTESLTLAWIAFALVATNPFHVLYSAASMTDVPFGCLVLASLWFLLRDRWFLAVIFAALAGCVRVEAWAFVVLLPLLQLARQRRVSVSLSILLLPPLTWLFICWLATGDPFSFFAERARYHADYLDFFPTRHGFVFTDVAQDAAYFLLGANRVVVLTIVAAGIMSILRPTRARFATVPIVLAYAAALFAFFVLAYVTKRQPVLLPRYGLIFFTLGLPLLMWLIQVGLTRYPRSWAVKVIATIVIALCLRETNGQITSVSKVLADFHAHQDVAGTLSTIFNQSSDRSRRCFSDDVAVRVLSGLSADCFVRSTTAPASAWQDRAAFESYLEQKHVGYVVFTRVEASLPAKHFLELGGTERNIGQFQLVTAAFSSFAPDVRLYRWRYE